MDSQPMPDLAACTPSELRELYETDPERFDQLANEAIKRACIGRTPEQTRKLQQLQWVIDAQLRKGKTPLQRLRIMETIFYDRVYSAEGLLSKLISSWSSFLQDHLPSPASKKPMMRLLKK